MAYEVLARKWRPQQFDQLVGQDHVARTLSNAITSGRIAHAYLFVGPRGIGKTSSARIFAKALNCIYGPTVTPCDKCESCLEIMNGSSLDVIEIDGASNTGVDNIRDLRENAQYSPVRGPYKIYIIDEVHMLSRGAFNALLKTLEEPPKHVKFIFATTEPQKVLPTILSRCQRFDLRPISAKKIMEHLRTICDVEKVDISDDAIFAIARGAEGGMRDAESALDQLISFCGGKVTEKDVMSVFGLVSRQVLESLVTAIIKGDVSTAIQCIDDLDQSGKDMLRLIVELIRYVRNLLIVQFTPEQTELLDTSESHIEVLREQAERTDSDHLLRMIQILTDADERMRYALSRRTLLEVAVIQCARVAQVVPIGAVLKALGNLQNSCSVVARTAPPPAVTGEASATYHVEGTSPAKKSDGGFASPPPPKLDFEAELALLNGDWTEIRARAKRLSMRAGTCLNDAVVVAVEESSVTIGFDPQFSSERTEMETIRNRKAIGQALKDKLKRAVDVHFIRMSAKEQLPSDHLVEKKNSVNAGKVKIIGQSTMSHTDREKWTKNEQVKLTLEEFNGDIVDIRV